MAISRHLDKVGGAAFFRQKAAAATPPLLSQAKRFPYGPFSFKAALPQGSSYTIFVSTDVIHWHPLGSGVAAEPVIEYIDSDASKFSSRFYRLLANDIPSQNVLGFVAVMLVPGFSLIGNPLDSPNNTVAELFEGWPDDTCVSKFDNRLYKLSDNRLQRGRWSRLEEKLAPGDGAIFYKPSNDYKSHSFVGELQQGNLAMPVQAGFSLRSSLVPRAGNLQDDLAFPIADDDVIHLFDRERQKYLLHPFEKGKWQNGPPILGVGESFSVAKTAAANWTQEVVLT
jgi:hypothetical protein